MMKERLVRLENQDKKEDQQRYMVWFSALSVTAFIVVLMLPVVPLERVDHLSSIASTWVISNMGIIGAFIASNAFKKKEDKNE
jgi:FtsH-binding integral membrane protein